MCRIKYYNGVLFHNVQQNFIVQTGDPTGTGKGGSSIDGCARLADLQPVLLAAAPFQGPGHWPAYASQSPPPVGHNRE